MDPPSIFLHQTRPAGATFALHAGAAVAARPIGYFVFQVSPAGEINAGYQDEAARLASLIRLDIRNYATYHSFVLIFNHKPKLLALANEVGLNFFWIEAAARCAFYERCGDIPIKRRFVGWDGLKTHISGVAVASLGSRPCSGGRSTRASRLRGTCRSRRSGRG